MVLSIEYPKHLHKQHNFSPFLTEKNWIKHHAVRIGTLKQAFNDSVVLKSVKGRYSQSKNLVKTICQNEFKTNNKK